MSAGATARVARKPGMQCPECGTRLSAEIERVKDVVKREVVVRRSAWCPRCHERRVEETVEEWKFGRIPQRMSGPRAEA